MFQKISTLLLILLAVIFIFDAVGARAQETEAAAESQLLQVMIPAGAQRVAANSVPAEITQLFDKVTTAGNGKFRQGETEVLLWSSANYKKTNALAIVNRFSGALKDAGWKYAVQGEENGVTLFTALQETPRRRAVIGFYGASADALILAAMEILPMNGSGSEAVHTQNADAGNIQPAADDRPAVSHVKRSGGGSVIGTWGDGYSSILSGYTPTVGPKSYTPGRSHRFEYTFNPNGTYTFTGLSQNTIYSCTTTIFNDQRGTYKINGNQITMTKSKNFFRRSDTCSAANNLEINHTLGSETYTFNISRNDRGKEQFCFNSGNGDTCYERAEK